MQKLRNTLILCMLGCAASSAAPLVFAQSSAIGQALGSAPPPVEYTVAPNDPEPNSPVYITVAGVGNFIGDSPITWRENGVTVSSGIGDRTFSFTTGGLGKTTTISISIDSTQYGVITNTWAFNPSYVNLIWEAQTSVPPWYQGHALYSPGAALTVFAFPEVMQNGKLVSTSELSYQWTLDGNAQVTASGMGDSSFTFNGSELNSEEDVVVDVSLNGNAVAHDEILIPVSQPSLVWYVHDPLRGILYNQALQNAFAMSGQEVTLRAEPYFFSIGSGTRGDLQYSFTLDGQDTTGPDTANGELTLRTSGTQSGSAGLDVSLQNTEPDKNLQGAQNALNISFGTTSSSLFGL